MSPFWKNKIYKTLLGLNSIVSYFLRVILAVTLGICCIPCFVIIAVALVVGITIVDWQEKIKEKLEVWANGENPTIHE